MSKTLLEVFATDQENLDNMKPGELDSSIIDTLAEAGVNDSDLASVSGLAEELLKREAVVKEAEATLAQAKKAYDEISNELLPTAMDAVGMSEFTLEDGTTIGVDTFYSASIPADSQEKAFDWLEQEGHAGIIKHEVKLALKKGQAEEAALADRLLRENGLEPTVDMKVHASTLRAFVREEVEAGREITPAINVYVGRRSKVR